MRTQLIFRTGRAPLLRSVLTILLIFSIGSFSLSASAQAEEYGYEKQVTVTDMRGRSISVPETIESVIALEAGSLRLLGYLGVTDRIIAVEDVGHGREKSPYDFFSLATYRLAFPELKELPSIGNKQNHEGLIAADPDLIICSAVDPAELDRLQEILGIPVFGVDVDVELDDSSRFFDQLAALGSLFSVPERARELSLGIQKHLDNLSSRARSVTEPVRAYAGGMMFFGPANLLRTTGDFLPFDQSGALNVMASNPTGNRQPYMSSIESLIEASPEYVFVDSANLGLSKMGYLEKKELFDQQVPAFREQQVYSTLVYKYYGTNWENQLINSYIVGKVLYPGLYEDVAIEQLSVSILDLFYSGGLGFDELLKAQRTTLGRVDWF